MLLTRKSAGDGSSRARGGLLSRSLGESSGATMDRRDDILNSTPLGWACRWGRLQLVRLLLEYGADREETNSEPWARPRSWALKLGHDDIVSALG